MSCFISSSSGLETKLRLQAVLWFYTCKIADQRGEKKIQQYLNLSWTFLSIWHLLNRQTFNIMGNYANSSSFHGTPQKSSSMSSGALFTLIWGWAPAVIISQNMLKLCQLCNPEQTNKLPLSARSRGSHSYWWQIQIKKPETIMNCESCPNLSWSRPNLIQGRESKTSSRPGSWQK